MSDPEPVDPFARLRQFTSARIGLGRSGDALPTRELLEFQLAASRARDAVHAAVDVDALRGALAPLPGIDVRSRVANRAQYLARPDLGRLLDAQSAAKLDAMRGDFDLAIVIGDGLSAFAVMQHAAALAKALVAAVPGLRVAPIVIATQARVALGDDVAQRLGARMGLMLVGERPGLSAADSLGAYLTFAPEIGRHDSARNCVSNIREPGGLPIAAAARVIAWLIGEARRIGATGVNLKVETMPQGLPRPSLDAES